VRPLAPTAAQPVVVVLGFHRSGTSMVTRMLNLLGVDLGAEEALLPPEERDNARGYWEPRWMIELNEELLAALGSGTFEPFRPQPGWERSSALTPVRERAQALLADHFADRPLWGWKDPRTSLTLPFWRELVDAPLRCVVCVRSPADALASILKRNIGINRWTYAERWLDYVGSALEATDPDERMLVFYEDALHDPAGEARRLSEFIGIEPPSSDRLAAIEESVDPDLRHHRSNAVDVAVDPGLPVETRALYLQLRAGRLLEHAGQLDVERVARERLPLALALVGAEQRASRSSALEADARAARAETQLAERDTELGRRDAELDRRDGELQRRDAELAEAEEQLRTVKADCDRLEQDLERCRATLTAVTTSTSWRLTRPLRAVARRMRG